MKSNKLAWIVLLIWFTSSYACFVPPKSTKLKPLELISNTASIYLVELKQSNVGKCDMTEKEIMEMVGILGYDTILSDCISKSYGSLELLDFKVLEVLKGEKKESIKIRGMIIAENKRVNYMSFQQKHNDRFNLRTDGSSQILPSCEIVQSYLFGEKYLVFIDGPSHFKSNELIEDPEVDSWYKFVKVNL